MTQEQWQCEHAIETTAAPAAIWRWWADTASWKQWNPGVADVRLSGPFATGSWFEMTLPDGEVVKSRLDDVQPLERFVDETLVGELRVRVSHRIVAQGGGRARIVYALDATGPDAAQIGPMISADFPAVIAALAALAEKA
jgi:uncharacterized protein YndB with AHSA1/START domain